jgi:glycosyltransferase involved in cell wall biosynthesis
VVQVGFDVDAARREPDALLDAWSTLTGAAAGAARAGVDVTVVQASHATRSVARDGVRVDFVGEPRGRSGRLARDVVVATRPRRLLAHVASLAPDVVHVHGLHRPRAVRQLARAVRGVPILVQDHGSLPPRGWRADAWRWAYRSIAGVAFTARAQAEAFFAAGALRGDVPVFEVVGGSSAFSPGDREAARRATGMWGAPCLLWTGRLDANKDPFTALAAFERAARRLPGARLWCCHGEAPLLDEVRARIAASPLLGERVTLLGTRPHAEMELHFRAADFYLQASHREASGFSLLEAMACGAVPLATDIPAARRIVGDAGSLTPVGDAAPLADAIVAWAGRDVEALRRGARARFEEALTYDAVGRELRAAYEAVAR